MYSRCILLTLAVLLVCSQSCLKPKEYLNPEVDNLNIDGIQLAKAFANAGKISDLQGLAVVRHGVLAAEEYFNDASEEPDPDLHVMSVTKSITSTLVGIAIEEGFIDSVGQTLSDFLGTELDNVNPELGQVTIHQLLTMSCGQVWHELGEYSEFNDFATSTDHLNYIMDKAIVNTPGTVFNYSDGAAHLVSFVITRATGMETSVFADYYLFGPLRLGDRIWYGDNRQVAYGGVGLCIGILDMLKIGLLYLNNGNYLGEQIVPADWIETATSLQISSNGEVPFLSDYGYYWWLGKAHGHDFICANGYGGQFIFIVKDLDLVVCSRNNYKSIDRSQAGQNWYNTLDIIINQVLPAVNED